MRNRPVQKPAKPWAAEVWPSLLEPEGQTQTCQPANLDVPRASVCQVPGGLLTTHSDHLDPALQLCSQFSPPRTKAPIRAKRSLHPRKECPVGSVRESAAKLNPICLSHLVWLPLTPTQEAPTPKDEKAAHQKRFAELVASKPLGMASVEVSHRNR